MTRLQSFHVHKAIALGTGLLLSVATLGNAQNVQVIEFTPAVADNDIDEFAISPDGTQIAFVGSLVGDAADQAYVAPIGGGAAVRVTPDDAGEVDGNIVWTPDGLSVAVRYDKGFGNVGNNVYLLPADGTKVEKQLTFSPTNDFDLQITPDGSTLLFSDNRQDEDFNGDDLTYSAPIAVPGASTLITPDDVTEIDTGSYAQVGSDLVWSSTAGTGNGAAEDRFQRGPIDASAPPTEIIVNNVPAAGDIDEMLVTPDNQTIIFIADLTTDGVDELYSLPIAGGDATQLLPNIQGFTDVGGFVISPDGSTIAFQADYRTNGEGEIYILPIDGGVEPVRVSQYLGDRPWNADATGAIGDLAFSNDGKNLYYIADGRFSNLNEIFVTRIPEPTTLLLSLLAMVGLAARRQR